ncbi:MAG: hypothetical protein F6K00_31710 [Leptolyngbya sp. SIOISBB]|nr:hypothetical protein [Leptolyngbya sp. SIOISBB]
MTKVSLHRFAKLPQRFLLALGLGMGILTVGAIAPPPSLTEEAPTSPTTTVDHAFAQLPNTLVSTESLWREADRYGSEVAKVGSPQPSAPATQSDFLTITLYTPTASCETYAGEAKAIATDKAIPQIVHFLLTDQTPNLLDFELSGYRILPGDKGNTVTVDFRRKPDATRHFISLSICEQRVLFGSLRETLLQNPELGIDDVKFTEQGKPILL